MISVAIIGYGEFGIVLERLLKTGGVSLSVWDKDPAKVLGQKSLADSVKDADVLFLCIPSWAVSDAIVEISPYLKQDALVVGLSKGIDKQSNKTIDQLLDESLPSGQPWVLMSGPMIAEELMRGMPGSAVVTSPKREDVEKLQKLFSHAPLSLSYSSDTHGVALAGALKNIYAIGAGIIDALELGWNVKGWYMMRSVQEMGDILELLGGTRETALGVSGFADLVATGFSPNSRNHQIGLELVKTGTCCLDGEGYVSFPSVLELLGENTDKFQIFSALNRIIVKGEQPKEIILSLLRIGDL